MPTVRDIKKSLVKMDVYSRELGPFSAFLSSEHKESFHRQNLEYYQAISNQTLDEIASTNERLVQIALENFRQNQKIEWQLEGLNESVNEISKNIYESNKSIKNCQKVLTEILDTLKSPEATRAFEKSRQASDNIIAARDMTEERASFLANEAIELLDEAISINAFDYKALFERGWLAKTIEGDIPKSVELHEKALIRSLSKDKEFAVFILRNLASAYRELDDLAKAKSRIDEAHSISQNLNSRLELERFIIHFENGESNVANNLVEFLSKKQTLFASFFIDPEIQFHSELWNALNIHLTEKVNGQTRNYLRLIVPRINDLNIHHKFQKKGVFGKWEEKYRHYTRSLDEAQSIELASSIETQRDQKQREILNNLPYDAIDTFEAIKHSDLSSLKSFISKWFKDNTELFIDEKNHSSNTQLHEYTIELLLNYDTYKYYSSRTEEIFPLNFIEQRRNFQTKYSIGSVSIKI